MSSEKDPKIQYRDFNEFYDTRDALIIGKKAVESSDFMEEAATLAMKGRSSHKGYKIKHANNSKNITLGRRDRLPLFPNDSLVLSDKGIKKRPALVLRYGIYANEIVIGYIQSNSTLDTLDKYLSLKEDLGVRPHEFMVAQFLARIAPALDEHPNAGVFLALHYVNKPVYTTIRDRFFDRNYSLNPNKERVRQILGENNTWLKPEAIQSRQGRLDEIVEGREKGTKSKIRRIEELLIRESGFSLPKKDWRDIYI
jgi:hypothetical protein